MVIEHTVDNSRLMINLILAIIIIPIPSRGGFFLQVWNAHMHFKAWFPYVGRRPRFAVLSSDVLTDNHAVGIETPAVSRISVSGLSSLNQCTLASY